MSVYSLKCLKCLVLLLLLLAIQSSSLPFLFPVDSIDSFDTRYLSNNRGLPITNTSPFLSAPMLTWPYLTILYLNLLCSTQHQQTNTIVLFSCLSNTLLLPSFFPCFFRVSIFLYILLPIPTTYFYSDIYTSLNY